MKKIKALVLFFAIFALASCELLKEDKKEDYDYIETELKTELSKLENSEGITNDIELVDSIKIKTDLKEHEIDISYTSSNTVYLKDDGKVVRPKNNTKDEEVVLTAKVEYEELDFTKELNYKILAYRLNEYTISINNKFGEITSEIIKKTEDTPLEDAILKDMLDETDYPLEIIDNVITKVGDYEVSETCDSEWVIYNGDTKVETDLAELSLMELEQDININLEVNEDCFVELELIDGFSVSTKFELELAGYKTESAWELFERNKETLQYGCNLEGYVEEIDFDCTFYAPGLGYSLRAIYGIPSTWYGSYLAFYINGGYAKVGISTQVFEHGDKYKIEFSSFGDDYQTILDLYYPNGFTPNN